MMVWVVEHQIWVAEELAGLQMWEWVTKVGFGWVQLVESVHRQEFFVLR